jgi:ubiquitin carboxyl-terminal hydrolase 34
LNDDVSSDLVENPTAFADAMIGILLTSLTPRPNQGLDGLRMETAKLCYKALLGVFDRQRSFWEAFAANELAVDIHSRILLNDNLHQIAGQIITFCDQTTNTAIPDFYLHVMTSILPQTLKHGTRARSFYQFAQDLLFRVGALNVRTDEKKARDLVDLLLTLALNYEHSETVDLPITDCAMLGVLKILHSALNILKAFKRPLLLNNISVKVFQTLLFPLNAGEYDRTLLHQESRRLAFGIVEMTCESRDAFSDLCSAMLDVLQPSKRYVLEYICYADWAREASACAGLDNLGMTCYMNSLIQQLYANVHFRQFIFETPLLDKEKQACLAQIQILFARMQTQADRSIRPIELARTLNIRTDSQEDVHGFYEDFLSRLETEMPDAASKTALNQFFTGRLLSQIKGECGHVSTRTEPFVDLPVLVKNKPGLKESLDEFVQGEPMEGANKYKCLACDPMGEGRLVDAMKRACPEMIPDNLTFCLKRFSFEAMFNMDDKVNDKFEFPQTIDMSSYHHKKVEDPSLICAADPFELVGVIVHQGTLQFGHYWSYTLLRNTPESTSRVWVRLEDKNAHICPDGFETVQRECTGGEWFTNGQERTDNAYVLFYQRKSVLEETLSVVKPARDPLTGDLLPARIKLPEALELTLRDENRDHYLANHVAHLDFSVFASWLVENLHRFTENSPATSESGDSEGDVSPKDSATSVGSVATQLEMSVAGVVVALIQRLATCDSDPLTKLQCITDRLCSTIDKKPSLAHPFLARILQDGSWTRLLVIDGRNMRRLGLAHIVQLLLLALRETDELTYRSMFVKLCDQLEVIFELKRENAFQFNWNSAFEMVGWMASKGAWETAQILRHSFLRFALDMLYLPWSEQLQAEVPYALQFMKRRTPQVTSLYRFITFVLGQPWIRMHNTDHDDRKVVDLTDDGTAVVPPDLVKCLHGVSTACPMSFWMRSAILADRNHQENFPPAKLMSLLLTSDHVPEIVKASIPRSLELYIDTEEESLNPVLYLVEEFCAACNDDTRASQAMRQLVKTIPLWERCDAAFANFIVRVNNIASRAVAENLGVWYSSYIGPNSNTNKPAKICNDVAQWLRCTFFGVTSLVDDEFEGTRVRLARKMIRDLVPKIQYAYEHEQPRSRCEPAITVLEGVSEYLDQLQSYMSATSGRSASEALKAEYQELDADVADLWGLKSILGEWEMDSPTQFVTVNDIASEGSVISEEDEDIEPSGWIDDEDTGAGG